jgi:hypothetical protein
VARKQRSKGKGPGGPQASGAPAQQRPQGGGSGGGGWGPLRDSIRRDIEQAVAALAFAERLHQKLDTQRRVFLDFPRAMEQLRSGAIERVAVSLSRLYEGGQGFDLQRFLRDLPLALAQLAATDRSKSIPPPASSPSVSEASGAPAAEAATETATETAKANANSNANPNANADATPNPTATETETGTATPTATEAPTAAASEAATQTVSPRLELRSKLLAAAPQLAKAAASYRRNVGTLKRAALPRRSPGPWRADREVLEEARRAVEFVQKLYDAYAEAWADQPLTPNLHEQTTDELDRFLAWTQLDRYVELAVLASTNVPRPPKPGQHFVGAPRPSASAPPAAAPAESPPATATEAATPTEATATPTPTETATATQTQTETQTQPAAPTEEPGHV